jgi:hypothetical protein
MKVLPSYLSTQILVLAAIGTIICATSLALCAQTQFATTATAEGWSYAQCRCPFGCVGPSKQEKENAKVNATQKVREEITRKAEGSCEAEAAQRGLSGSPSDKVLVSDYSFNSADCTVENVCKDYSRNGGPDAAVIVSCQVSAKILCQVLPR